MGCGLEASVGRCDSYLGRMEGGRRKGEITPGMMSSARQWVPEVGLGQPQESPGGGCLEFRF